MKTKLLILFLVALSPLTGRTADNSIAGPKVDPSNRSQVPWRTTDDGSGNQALHVVVDSGGGGGAVTIADGADSTLGAKADSVASSDTGTFSLIALIKRSLQSGTTQITTQQAIQATVGATNGTKVITDANGTLQQYLRGLIYLWINGLPAGTNLLGKVGIDQTTPGTTNGVQLTGSQLTPSDSVISTNGTVAAGKHKIEFVFKTDFAGTINSISYSFADDAYRSYEAPPGYTLAAISYTVSAGTAVLTTY